MANFFYTSAIKAESLEEMKEVNNSRITDNIDYFERNLPWLPKFDWIDLSYAEDTFKGFNKDKGYYDSVDPFFFDYFYSELVYFLYPEVNAKDKTISYFESEDKRDRGIRTVSKIGKFIRKAGPYYNDKQVEWLVNIILDEYVVPEYIHKVATTRQEFKEVYTSKPEKGRNIGDNYSCINASCMRGRYDFVHPCEVYASGEFELHYLVNDKGEIAARTILCVNDEAYANVYVSNKQAGKQLEEIIKGIYEDAQHHDDVNKPWNKAKLLKIEIPDGIAAPYIDVCQEVKDCGDYLEINYYGGDYCFSSTGGYVELLHYCQDCGGHQQESEMVELDGEWFCTSCCNHCEYYGEWTREETVEVYNGPRNYHYDQWSQSAADNHAVYDEEDEKWYTKDYYEELVAERESEEEEIDEDDETEIQDETQPEIKVGDYVKIIGNGNSISHHHPIGSIGRITHVCSNYYEVMYNNLSQLISPADLERA